VLPESTVNKIIKHSEADNDFVLNVDLASQKVWSENEEIVEEFEIEPFRRHCLLNGLDDIGLTLENESEITKFESARSQYGGILDK